MKIYNKSTLQLVGQTQHNTTVDWEIENNVIPNFGGIKSDYETIETELQRFHLETVNGEVVAVEDGLTVEEQKQAIKQELEKLDLIIPRVVEDIASQGNFVLDDKKIEIIEQKEILREQLRALGV